MKFPHLNEIKSLPYEKQLEFFNSLTNEELLQFKYHWPSHARENQMPPDKGWYEALFLCGRGWGKLICKKLRILTPSGFVELGDVKVGDKVIDENGKECNVLAIYDNDKPDKNKYYKLTFSDGTETKCCGDHLWTTWTHRDRKSYSRNYKYTGESKPKRFTDDWPNWKPARKKKMSDKFNIGPSVKTTQEIIDTFTYGKRKDTNHSIPVCKPVEFEEKELIVDPYLLGYWLGDGSTGSGTVIVDVSDRYNIENYIKSLGYKVGNTSDSLVLSILGLITDLKKIKAETKESIPNDYYIGSIEQRTALLQGLLDSDGYIDKVSGKIEFSNSREWISDLVFYLAASLGQKPRKNQNESSLNGVREKDRYRVIWRPTWDIKPFTLERKAKLVKSDGGQSLRNYHRMITSYVEIDKEPMRCLTVDSPNNLFLVTEALIPTHNTRCGAEAVRNAVEQQGCMRLALIGPTVSDVREVMFGGEALCLDTDIPTPDGWKKMGDLSVGDFVYSSDGTETRIKAVSQVWNNRDCYSIKFTNSSQDIICDGNHKWVVTSRAQKRKHKKNNNLGDRPTSVLYTKDIFKNQRIGKDSFSNYEIPIHDGIKGDNIELPIPPYTLGAWLGDGNSKNSGFSQDKKDYEVIQNIIDDGFIVSKQASKYSWFIRGLSKHLRDNNLIKNKHIPDLYFKSSFSDRLKLFNGLMDTDGTVSTNGRCEIGMSNEELVYQIRQLCLSLGYQPTSVNVRPEKIITNTNYMGSKFYRFTFHVDGLNPFKLKRKAKRCDVYKIRSGQFGRNIQSVSKVDSVPTVCISVEHESQTFLCGRDFLVTHNSGLDSISPPWMKPKFIHSKAKIEWPNGATALVISAEEPESLRGPQFDFVWWDEPARCKKAQAVYDGIHFGLRLDSLKNYPPRLLMTTTPRAITLIKNIYKRYLKGEDGLLFIRGNTDENKDNLSKKFINRLEDKFGGTRMGRQDLNAEILEDHPDALWTDSIIDACKIFENDEKSQDFETFLNSMERVVIGVDPSGSDNYEGDETGIIIAGKKGKTFYVLGDYSVQGSPETWASSVKNAFDEYLADNVIAEKNNGGTMVRAVLQASWSSAPIELVHAKRGKHLRAQPISRLYEQGKVKHWKDFPELEAQMSEMTLSGFKGENSPDRLDAAVYALMSLSSGTSTSKFDFRVEGVMY